MKFIPLSTCEAEVAAHVMMVKEGKFVLAILQDMKADLPSIPLPTVTDSKSGMEVIHNPGVTKHTAHFERWLQWGRHEHLNGGTSIHLAPTDKMMADDKTKVVDRSKLLACRKFQINEY